MLKFNKDFNVKIISILVAVSFLFNSTVYGIDLSRNTPPDKLRPPSHFSKPTEEFIISEHSSTPIEELVARKGKRIIFSLPRKPKEKYQLQIQKDVVSAGVFTDPNEKSQYMLYVETILSGKEYPVGIATGISTDEDGGIMNLEWISVLDYARILEEIKKFRAEECREGTSLFAAMAIYFMLGPETEYQHQVKFLYVYFTSKLKIKTDEDVIKFFENAPTDLKRKGLGNAIAEFITSFAPIGSKIRFILNNQESLEALREGQVFQNTAIGAEFKALGYEVVQETKMTLEKYPAYILEKRNIPILKTTWEDRGILGQYCRFSDVNETHQASSVRICQ